MIMILFAPFFISASELNFTSWGNFVKEDGIYAYSFTLTKESDVVVAGYYYYDQNGETNNDNVNAIIFKYDKDKKLIWEKSFGGSKMDTFKDIVETSDGGYVVVGHTASGDIDGLEFAGGVDALIAKYDVNGNLIWKNTFSTSENEHFMNVIETADGGYIAYDYIYENFDNHKGLLVKYSSNGEEEWHKIIDNDGSDFIRDILLVEKNQILVLVDNTSSSNNFDSTNILIKYDSNGNIVWQKNWGGNSEDSLLVLDKTENGYVSYGSSYSSNITGLEKETIDDPSAVLVFFDEGGNIINQKSWNYEKISYAYEEFNNIIQLPDGGYILSGVITDEVCSDLCDPFLLKLDKELNIVWENIYEGDFMHEIKELLLVNSNRFYAFKETYNEDDSISGLEIIEFDINGQIINKKKYDSDNSIYLIETKLSNNPGFILALSTFSDDITQTGAREVIISEYFYNSNVELLNSFNGTFDYSVKGFNIKY